MINKMIRGGACVAVLLAAAVVARADDTAYPIKFDRPEKVGQVFDISNSLESTASQLVESDGKEVSKASQKSKAVLEGTLTVLALDKKNHTKKFHLVINKIQASEGDAALADVGKPGTELDATYDNDKVNWNITKGDENSLMQAAIPVLTVIFPARPPEAKVTNDDIIGTKDKKKVGDSWNTNAAMMGLNPDKTRSKMKLEAVKTEGGVQWLQLVHTVESSELTDSQFGKSTEAKMTGKATELLPVDNADPSDKIEATDDKHAVWEVEQEGQSFTVTREQHEKRSTAMVLHKKDASSKKTDAPKKEDK